MNKTFLDAVIRGFAFSMGAALFKIVSDRVVDRVRSSPEANAEKAEGELSGAEQGGDGGDGSSRDALGASALNASGNFRQFIRSASDS